MVEPEDPPDGASKTKIKIWEMQVAEFCKRQHSVHEHIKTLYSLIWGQCSDIMRQRIEALDSFDKMSSDGDGIALLIAIKGQTFNFQSQKYLPHAMHETKRRFYFFSQGKSTMQMYHEQFQNLVQVIETIKGSIGVDPGIEQLVATDLKKDIALLTEADKKVAQERYLAVVFILRADRSWYSKIIENLENDFLQGRNNYPKTVTSAYNLLINWKQDPRNLMRSVGVSNDGVSFTNVDGDEDDDGDCTGVSLNTNGQKERPVKDKSKVVCRRCGEKGHYPSNCDNKRLIRNSDGSSTTSTTSSLTSSSTRQSGATMLLSGIAEGEFEDNLTTAFQFLTHTAETVFKTGSAAVLDSWILLDNQSTVDVFHNAKLLRNIRQSDSFMDIHCNAGVTSTNLIGDLPGYGTVWYHPNGIANILSLTRVKEHGCKVTYDSDNGNCFRVVKPDGSIRVFSQSERGLFYMPTDTDSVALVNTVDDNRSRYNNRDYSRAEFARKLQSIIGRPNTRRYMAIVDRNLLPNCPINRGDIAAAEDIFGPDVGNLKGKTVRRPTPHVPSKLIAVPMKLMKQYRDVTLAGDIMFVNRIPFFVTISHHIRFSTAEMLANQKAPTLLNAVKQIRNVYAQRGFRVVTFVMDGQ